MQKEDPISAEAGMSSQSTSEGYGTPPPPPSAVTREHSQEKGQKHSASGGVPVELSLKFSCKTCETVTILDGGMGHQLKAMGIEIKGEVGSIRRFLGVAVANTENPQMVKDAHLAYIDAGAQVVTTNNYACVPKCLEHADGPSGEGDSVLHNGGVAGMVAAAGKLAREACDERPGCNAKVAGCMPPLAESYRADLVGPYEQNLEQYLIIAKSIAPFSDLLICETMSTVDEARAAVTAGATTGLPIWVSWTLKENEPVLRSGESLKDAVEAVMMVPGAKVEACLFNCTSPEIVSVAMPQLRELAPGVRIGAYANGFSKQSADGSIIGGCGEYRDLSPNEYHDSFAADWIKSGATTVGGCCGIFPKHISHLKKMLH